MKRKGFFEVTVSQCFEIGKEIFFLELECDMKVKGGQFILFKPLNKGSVMPRPFSVHNCDDGKISILFKKIGLNTELYSRLEAGDKVKIAGPLGKPLPIEPEARRYFLVGGGIGVAPLGLLGKDLHSAGKEVRFLIGAKTTNGLAGIIGFQSYGNVEAITEVVKDKHFGKRGLVTDLLENRLKHDKYKSVVVACGPKPMLKKVAEMCMASGNKCYVLLEEVMACGVGSCKGCAVFGVDGTVKHVCHDGPIFEAEWVDWDKIVIPKTPALSKSRKTANPMRVVLRGGQGRKLILFSPTMLASGCSDLEPIEKDYLDISHVGAIVAKGLTLHPQAGNPTPRVCEVAGGMLNSIGLENDGVAAFVKEKLPRYRKLGIPVIANINGHKISDYFQSARILRGHSIDAVEVNVACPDIQSGGMLFGVSPKNTLRIVKGVRKILPRVFLIVKLTPNITDVVPIVEAAIRGGADAVSAINTVLGMAIDVKTRRPKIARVMGGLSGPAIKPIGVRIVRQIRRIFPHLPIIGMGGIGTGEDAAEYIMAGANAVAVGTGLFKNPNAMTEIHDGLLEIMKLHGANHISDLIGSLIV